jgi:hypothetical protein
MECNAALGSIPAVHKPRRLGNLLFVSLLFGRSAHIVFYFLGVGHFGERFTFGSIKG